MQKNKLCAVLHLGNVFNVRFQRANHTPAFGFTNLRLKYEDEWFDVLTDRVYGNDFHILRNGEKLPVLTNFRIRAGYSGVRK